MRLTRFEFYAVLWCAAVGALVTALGAAGIVMWIVERW